ncbi:MAG: riboflavin synthase, partial [Verrucomicrobiota bacterium]
AIQGVCLTLTGEADGELAFDLLLETLERTNLGALKPGDPVNLERSLCYGDAMGGHIVQGHVDGVGTVSSVEPRGQDHIVTVTCDGEHLANMVMKGSIGLDGISLTIAGLTERDFSVHIIPHTWKATSMDRLKTGVTVNLETDVLAKYARRWAESGRLGGEITWDGLRKGT